MLHYTYVMSLLGILPGTNTNYSFFLILNYFALPLRMSFVCLSSMNTLCLEVFVIHYLWPFKHYFLLGIYFISGWK